MTLNLEAKTPAEQKVKAYLEQNASEVLAHKINEGVKIVKDDKTLLNKKTLAGFLKFACGEAKKQAEKGAQSACIDNDTVYGWAVHYFEEDGIEGTLCNEDGTEYKVPVPKAAPLPTKYEPPKPKPQPQLSIFDMVSANKPADEENEESNDEPTDKDYAEAEETMQEEQPPVQIPPPPPAQLQSSPVWQRYVKLEQDYPDHIAIMRLGDFYEVFGENACILAKELPLTLTGRDVGLSERVPMIGFPYHAAQNYFQKMVRCGHRLTVMDSENNIYTLPPENVDPETGEVIDDLSEEEMRQFDGDIDETLPTVSKILAEGTPAVRSDEALAKEIASVIDDTPVTGAKDTASMPEDEDDPDMSAFDMDALCILSELFDNELELR